MLDLFLTSESKLTKLFIPWGMCLFCLMDTAKEKLVT
jgi:hypothetical protein